eukprot:COSAG05_NODE_2713_length_2739_cov_2.401136_2_plen_96_part_00
MANGPPVPLHAGTAQGQRRSSLEGSSDPYLLKEIASLVVGAAVTYFSMRAMLHALDPQREDKDKARHAKTAMLDRLGLSGPETSMSTRVSCAPTS